MNISEEKKDSMGIDYLLIQYASLAANLVVCAFLAGPMFFIGRFLPRAEYLMILCFVAMLCWAFVTGMMICVHVAAWITNNEIHMDRRMSIWRFITIMKAMNIIIFAAQWLLIEASNIVWSNSFFPAASKK